MRKLGRLAWRLLWLTGEILLVAARFGVVYVRRAGRPSRPERCVCLQHGCRRILRVFVNGLAVDGPRPTTGLLISNHLGYLDIMLLGSISPCVFVAKHEVKHWPVFGWLAALSGTVFVQRSRRGEVAAVAGQIRALLDEGALVILFPEGTSSGGQEILRFKSALLEPAVGQTCPLFAACVGYALEDGEVSQEVCYWGDMTLLPHFVNLLTRRFVQARVSFSEIRQPAKDRKALAAQLHAEVVRLKSAPVVETSPPISHSD